MLDTVVPEIMPVQGSRPDLALAKAKELLKRAGAASGEVILVGDDAGGARALAQAKALMEAGYELSVIGVGTKAGAPVPNAAGADGRPVISRLDPAAMQSLASTGGGVYTSLSADGRDLDRVLRATPVLPDQAKEGTQMQTEVWKELGPWILLAVLPLAALAFRRGWLLAIAFVVGSLSWTPEPAMASAWEDLWQRRDQQVAAALEAGEHQQAHDLAEQPAQRGTASYRLGDFEEAVQDFAAVDGADAQYNRGNALAKSGRLEDAIAAYDQALAEEPEMEDASYNKALIEKLLKQQEQQQQQQAQDQGQKGQQGEGAEDQQSKGQEGEEQSQSDKSSGEQSGQDEQSAKGEQGTSGAEQQGETASQQQSDTPQPEGQSKESAAGEDQARQQEQSRDSSQQSGSPQPSGKESSAGNGKDGQSGQDAAPGEAENPQEAERAAADYRKEAAEQAKGQPDETSAEPQTASGSEGLSPEEREAREATDQWLRRIPDDPAGLLRRKFLYQYRARAAQQGAANAGDPW
jgi:Ca-activated chloride channel family protein